MEQIAVREKGALETIAGVKAVLSPRNVYFVEIRPWIIGMVCPADRQEVAQVGEEPAQCSRRSRSPGSVPESQRDERRPPDAIHHGDRFGRRRSTRPPCSKGIGVEHRQFTGKSNDTAAAAKVLAHASRRQADADGDRRDPGRTAVRIRRAGRRRWCPGPSRC